MQIKFGERRLVVEVCLSQVDLAGITSTKVIEYLQANGVKTGVNVNAVKALLAAHPGVYVAVAEGTPPVDGSSTQFNLLFKNELKADKPKPRNDGSVDHRDLGYVLPVLKGDKIIEIIPPTLGEPGLDVCGYPVPPEPGKEIGIILGENTSITPDGTAVYAEVSGVASFSGMEVKIEKALIISTDIDYSVGNIYFPGDITVLGSVIDGFKIIAEGNVIIYKDVLNATVETKGSVFVKGIVNQKISGYIKANLDVEVGSAQFANITAGQRLLIEKESRSSNLTALNHLVADQQDSYIVGGKIRCYGRVEVYDLGSRVDASKMTVTFSENVNVLKRLTEISEIITENIAELKRLDVEIQNIEQYLASPGMSSVEFHEFEKIFEEFMQKKTNMERRNVELLAEKAKLSADLKAKDRPTLVIKNSIYPGVILEFPSRKMELTAEKRQVMIFEEANVIKFRPL